MMSYFIIAVLVLYGLFFTGASLLKLIGHNHFKEEFASMKIPYWLAYVSGGIEIICGPALVLGIWIPISAGLASAVLFVVMLGAVVTNFIAEGRGVSMAVAVLIIFALPMLLIAYYFRDATQALLG